MDQLEAMRVYARVAELASFTRAAQVLGWPKASVSTAVQRLEAQLGTRLLQRSTRRVHLTPDGQLYLERCRELLAELDELQQLFRPQAAGLQGRLRVDMPTGTARAVVVPRLPEFVARHPGLHIELGSTDRRVDLVGEGYDCVLRVGALEDSSLVARPLGRLAQLAPARPTWKPSARRARWKTCSTTGWCTTPPGWARAARASSTSTPTPAPAAACPWRAA